LKINIDFFTRFFAQDFLFEYSHVNYTDMVGGRRCFHMDCSGFVAWSLMQMGYVRALVELRSFLKAHDFIKINRFFCKDFAFIFRRKKQFKYWSFLPEPVSGCLLIILFPDGNGHCMFVDKVLAKGALRVIDCTRYPHKHDTRADKPGIGVGEITLECTQGRWFYNSHHPAHSKSQVDVYFVLPTK